MHKTVATTLPQIEILPPLQLAIVFPDHIKMVFQEVTILGRGNMGPCMLYQRPECGSKIAVKILKSDPSIVDKREFQNEIEFLNSIRTVAPGGIIQILGASANRMALAYEGQDLIAWSERDCNLRVDQLINNLAEALHFLHGRKLIHRDIKPENIVSKSPEVGFKLIDFGVVAGVEEQLGAFSQNVFCGTAGYKSKSCVSKFLESLARWGQDCPKFVNHNKSLSNTIFWALGRSQAMSKTDSTTDVVAAITIVDSLMIKAGRQSIDWSPFIPELAAAWARFKVGYAADPFAHQFEADTWGAQVTIYETVNGDNLMQLPQGRGNNFEFTHLDMLDNFQTRGIELTLDKCMKKLLKKYAGKLSPEATALIRVPGV